MIPLILSLTTSQAPSIDPHLIRTPNVHGNTVVFSYGGDLWVSDLEGGTARRLTSHPLTELYPRISADGKWVAFTGSYDGYPNIFVVSIDGGEPKRLTYDVEGDTCLGWTPDGKVAYASNHGNFINRQKALWLVSPKGGIPTKTVINEIGDGSFGPDGTLYYNRQDSWKFNWRHYRGGSQGRISIYNFNTNAYSELPNGREQSYVPTPVGRSIYYTTDREGGIQNLHRYDLDTKRDVALTAYKDDDVRTPSTDGKNVVFERAGQLYRFDIASGKLTRPAIRIPSENLLARPTLRNLANQITDFSISPSGNRIVVSSRGRLFSVATKKGDTRPFGVQQGVRQLHPSWSPDGKTIAYVSDRTGNYEVYTRPQIGGDETGLTSNTPGTIDGIRWSPDGKFIEITRSDNSLWILDVATKKQTKVDDAPYGFGGRDWSPDGKWIAYTKGDSNYLRALWMYEVATGKTTKASNALVDDLDVAFDLNGKFLYLASGRIFETHNEPGTLTQNAEPKFSVYVLPLSKKTPNPLITANEEEPAGTPAAAKGEDKGEDKLGVDLDGLMDRIIPLPVSPEEGYSLTGAKDGVFMTGGGKVAKFDLNSRESSVIFAGEAAFGFSNDRTRFAYFAGGVLGVSDVHPGITIGQGKVDTSGITAIVDPRAEWKQIYWDAWRYERDHFYDSKFRGLDWKALGDKYAAFLPDVNTRADLNYVIGLLIGELGTSHAYISGGDMGVQVTGQPLAYLGADYAVEGNYVKIAHIVKGRGETNASRSPLLEPGSDVHEGDYLLAINGEPVNASVDPTSLLINTADKYVTLTVNSKPSTDGARTVRVRPVATEGEMRYWEFVENNRLAVEKASGGRIGYAHVRDTGATGTVDLYRGFFGQTNKDAFLIDERWNGGGNLPNGFVELLNRRAIYKASQRNLADMNDTFSISGPKALLINGYAGSGGDLFPWLFKHQGVGPLIGKRTWGGLVGISGGLTLVDGGNITAPEFAIYDPATNEIIAENMGVDPDIDIDNRPDQVALGLDPQLQKGIDVLLEKLKGVKPTAPRTSTPGVGRKAKP